MAASQFEFTRARVDAATCPPGKQQALYWDTLQPGLGLRVTEKGARSFIFEGKLGGRSLRLTIGPATMQIRAAKDKRGRPIVKGADTQAAEWAFMLSQGRDPRAEVAAAVAEQQAARDEQRRQTLTARTAWDAYLRDRKPHWGTRHYADHVEKAAEGGTEGKRGKVLKPGPLAPLLAKPLRELDAPTIEAWAKREAAARPASGRLALRLLKAFLAWCAEHPDYAPILPNADAAKSKRAREVLGRPGVRRDALQREQLKAWFDAVRGMQNPVVAAYLQTVLLTGARPGEVLGMRWDDLNFAWKALTIRDKIEGTRVVPLTPYVARQLAALPRRNGYVFSGTRAPIVARPNEPHDAACKVAGVGPLSLHGLRRSYKSLSEWLETPAGVVAQLMGHKPSATAERHYTVRPLDLLRVHAERIEAWIVEQAGIAFDPKAEQAPRLAAVGG